MNNLYKVLDSAQIENLVDTAKSSDLRRARINFHPHPTSQVQEMLICAYSDTKIQIHAHSGKSESFCVLNGKLVIYLFDENSPTIIEKIELVGGSGKCYYRLDSSTPHLVLPKSDPCLFLEITCGPFVPGQNYFVPEWAGNFDLKSII